MFKIKFGKKYLVNSFKIVKKSSSIPFKENFILSALNLAFLGYYFKGDIPYNKNIIHWPDGLFAKTIFDRIAKIPGRLLLEEMIFPNDIKRIIVLGNLSKYNFNYLKNKFKIEIKHFDLPYGSFDKIKIKLNFIFEKNDIIFLTLPTHNPAQIAIELSKTNNHY